jgi:predicted Holliday junction resolvase-like endonuclease
MPKPVQEKVEVWRSDLRTRRLDLRERRRRAHEVAEKQTIDVNLGKILEKIAPVMGGFDYSPRDCRGLFDPIDYSVFSGLSAHKKVDALIFLDVKTGGAGLNPHQRQIRSAVEAGKVEWERYSLGEKP